MKKNLLITALQSEGKRQLLRIYLFGSFLSSDSYFDVDVLIVFSSRIYSMVDMLSYRNFIRTNFLQRFGVQMDILLLTENEAENNNFIEEEGCVDVSSLTIES